MPSMLIACCVELHAEGERGEDGQLVRGVEAANIEVGSASA